jgi:hypothetical protein
MYTQTIQGTSQNKQYIEQHKIHRTTQKIKNNTKNRTTQIYLRGFCFPVDEYCVCALGLVTQVGALAIRE